MVEFPVSGVEVNPLVPLLVAFVVSALTAPAGVSGASLLLPFQVSVLGFTSPAVSPTNLIFNVLATPGGVYRYVREGRVAWPLAWVVILGTLPGVFVGALLRVTLLSDPARFEAFVGLVLLYLGGRLLYETFAGREQSPEGGAGTVNITGVSMRRVGYEFHGQLYSFSVPAVFALSLVVGVIGGIYSIGGGSIIAPFLVTIFALPVYTVAGATLIGTFVTSVAGVAFFELLARTGVGPESAAVAPDWLLGTTLGIGGLAGTYAGSGEAAMVPAGLLDTGGPGDAGHPPGAALRLLAREAESRTKPGRSLAGLMRARISASPTRDLLLTTNGRSEPSTRTRHHPRTTIFDPQRPQKRSPKNSRENPL